MIIGQQANQEQAMAENMRFTTEQIMAVLKEADAERYESQKKLSDAQRLVLLEEENLRLRLIVADLTLRNEALKSLASKKW
jgi:hypothetical protein